MNGIVSGKTVDELSAYGKISEQEWNATFNSSDWNVTSKFIYASQPYLWFPLEITSLTTSTQSFGGTFAVRSLYTEYNEFNKLFTMTVDFGMSGAHTAGNVSMKFKVIEFDDPPVVIGTTGSSRYSGRIYLKFPNGNIYATYIP